MADAAEVSPVKKQKVKKNKDTAPATEPKKKSKRKSVDAADAPNTAPEATRKRKKKEVAPEEAAVSAAGKEPKKSKKRAAEALDGVGSAPELDREPEAGGADADLAEDGRQNGTTKKPKNQEAAPGPEEGKQGKKRRRRGKKVGEDEGLTLEERVRRQRQRELRALALQMRGDGKAYKRPPQKKAKVEPAGPKGGGLYSAKILQGAAQQADEEGSRPDHPVQVIVVPIFWNRKPEEKAQVIRAAEATVKLLEAAGLTTGADTTNAMSPGQKFAYWEGQGVMVRIECGPRDALRRECVLAVSKKAGEVAERQTLPVGPKLVKSVGAALGVDVRVTLSNTAKPANGSNASEGAAAKAVGVKRVAASGDDLGGDFGDLTVGEDAGSKKKHRK